MLSLTMLNTITQQRISSDVVQEFIRNFGFGKKATNVEKKERLSVLKINMKMQNLQFEDYFTNKKELVLLKIVQRLHHSGVTKIKASTLAKVAECSISTVYNTIKHIKSTKQIFVGQVGGKGHYLFIDKLHNNYEQAMQHIFGLDTIEANLMRNDLLIGEINCYNLDDESRLKSLLKAVKSNQDKSFMTDEEIQEAENKFLGNQSDENKDINGFATEIKQEVNNHYKNVLSTWSMNKELHNFYDMCQKYSSYEQVFNVMDCLYILLNECKYRFPTKQEVALAIQSYMNLTELFNSVSDRLKFNEIFQKVLIRSFEIQGVYTSSYSATRTYKKRKKKLKAQKNFNIWLTKVKPTSDNYFNEENLLIDGYYEEVNRKPKVSDVMSLEQFKKGKLSC